MKKRYKHLERNGKIYILHWESEGRLFGPAWDCVATFDNKDTNLERCKSIIRLMNECDKHTEHFNDDGKRNT